MANRIAGITIEIGGDTTKLQSALKGVNKTIKDTQGQLKDVEKLLKLDPTNTDLLRQKQKLLGDQVKATKEKLDTLKEAQRQMDAEVVDKNSQAYMALQREIIATEQELKQAESAAKNFNATLAKVSASATKVSEAAAKAADKTRALSTAAAGALTGLAGLAYKAATNADDLNTLAKQTGFTTAELQKMQYAADRIDVPMETITSAAAKMTKQLSSSEDKFSELGVATRDASGNFRSTSDIFYDTIKALSNIENETERDAIAMEIFGKSANELAGVIDDGGKALNEFGEEAENAGLILSQETLDDLNAVNDEIDRLKAQGAASIAKAGAAALQALTPVLEKVSGVISKILNFIAQLNPQQMQVIMTVLAVIAAVSPLLSLISKVSMAISLLASPVGLIILAIGALIAVGVLLYKNWDTIKEKAAEVWQSVKDAFAGLKEDIATIWGNIKDTIASAIQTAKDSVSTAISNIKTGAVNAFNSLKTSVSNIWDNIKNAITKPIETAKDRVKGIIDTIKSFLSIDFPVPHIRLPHFSWTWTDLGLLKIPHVSVEWYKKAYEQPYMFSSPTIVGNRGFGDGNGDEMVYGKDNLMRDIKEAMSSVVTDQPIVITVQSILDGKMIGKSVTRYQNGVAKAMGV